MSEVSDWLGFFFSGGWRLCWFVNPSPSPVEWVWLDDELRATSNTRRGTPSSRHHSVGFQRAFKRKNWKNRWKTIRDSSFNSWRPAVNKVPVAAWAASPRVWLLIGLTHEGRAAGKKRGQVKYLFSYLFNGKKSLPVGQVIIGVDSSSSRRTDSQKGKTKKRKSWDNRRSMDSSQRTLTLENEPGPVGGPSPPLLLPLPMNYPSERVASQSRPRCSCSWRPLTLQCTSLCQPSSPVHCRL